MDRAVRRWRTAKGEEVFRERAEKGELEESGSRTESVRVGWSLTLRLCMELVRFGGLRKLPPLRNFLARVEALPPVAPKLPSVAMVPTVLKVPAVDALLILL